MAGFFMFLVYSSPAAERARSAQGASQFAAGHAAARLASATTRPQQAQPINH